jgi:hypothetical protein
MDRYLERNVVAIGQDAAFSKGRDFAHWGVGISARLAASGASRSGSTRKANGSPLCGNPSRFAMFRTEPLASIGRNLM